MTKYQTMIDGFPDHIFDTEEEAKKRLERIAEEEKNYMYSHAEAWWYKKIEVDD